MLIRPCSITARWYSFGNSFTKRLRCCAQSARISIVHQWISPGGSTVIKLTQNPQTLLHNMVRSLFLDMGNEVDTAGIMFVVGMIKPRKTITRQ